MKVDIYAVANYCKVSKATVSRVVNNIPTVSEKTRKKVLQAIEILGYQPSKLARGLSSSGYDAILIISAHPTKGVIENPYFSQATHIIGSIAETHDFDIILQSTPDTEKEISKTLSLINDKLIKGIILLSSRVDAALLHALSKEAIPVVLIGKLPEDFKASNIVSVDTDDFKDSIEVGDYLINMGHRNVGCIYSPKVHNVPLERVNGFIQAFKNKDIPINNDYFVEGGYTLESAYDAATALLKNKEITAIFTTDDLKALSVYKAAKDMGLSIPDDISIVGHNDYYFSNLLTPSLTTVKVPIDKLGEVSSNILFSMIKGNIETSNNILIDTELIIRSSVRNCNP